jgi:hypothetical protein
MSSSSSSNASSNATGNYTINTSLPSNTSNDSSSSSSSSSTTETTETTETVAVADIYSDSIMDQYNKLMKMSWPNGLPSYLKGLKGNPYVLNGTSISLTASIDSVT